MILELQSQGMAEFVQGPVVWNGHSVRAHLAIAKDADGSFSVIVLNLPGCGSCGETEEDAVANTREAVKEVVESYRVDGIDVPWSDEVDCEDIPDGAKLKWIMVNV